MGHMRVHRSHLVIEGAQRWPGSSSAGEAKVDGFTQDGLRPSGRRGARPVAEKRPVPAASSPWEQTCLRMEIPEDGEQLTLFVLPEEERVVRAGTRARLRP